MGFFTGPSKDALQGMAQGVAVVISQVLFLNTLEPSARRDLAKQMEAEGLPTVTTDAFSMAGQVITEQNMGTHKRSQFLGMIQGNLVAMGISHAEATHYRNMIELAGR